MALVEFLQPVQGSSPSALFLPAFTRVPSVRDERSDGLIDLRLPLTWITGSCNIPGPSSLVAEDPTTVLRGAPAT